MPGQPGWWWYGHHVLRKPGRPPSGMTAVMVTAGHSACGPVTAMRSLSRALGNRDDREGAARHRPVGSGRRDGHDRRHPGRRRTGHADGNQAPACSSDPAGIGRHRGGHCLRPGGSGGVRDRADRGSRKTPAAERPDESPARSGPPEPRGAPPRARLVTGARPGPAPGQPAARRRSRLARGSGAFRAAACPEPDERLLTGRAYRRAQGWPWTRDVGRRGHPGAPAHGRTWPGSERSGRRVEPGPAVVRPGRTSAAASGLPAGHEPGRSRPGRVRPGRPARASHAAWSRTPARGTAARLPDAGP